MLRLQLGHTHSLFFHWLYTCPKMSTPGWSTISAGGHDQTLPRDPPRSALGGSWGCQSFSTASLGLRGAEPGQSCQGVSATSHPHPSCAPQGPQHRVLGFSDPSPVYPSGTVWSLLDGIWVFNPPQQPSL